jgi:hypothetical protein
MYRFVKRTRLIVGIATGLLSATIAQVSAGPAIAMASAQARAPEATAYYSLVNAAHGDRWSLDIRNDDALNNQPVLARSGNFSGQHWRLTKFGDGYYRMTTQWLGDQRSLDIINDGRADATAVLADSADVSGQQWKITPLPDGNVRLTTRWRGADMALGVVGDGAAAGQLVLAHVNGEAAQRWTLSRWTPR